MKMNQLGRTGIEVSAYCLGTMTFGTQTAPREAHEQIDRALAAGINFLDTAEMYPVNPVAKETIGRTEEIIGDWIARVGQRDRFILATKHSGEGLVHVRDGAPISAATIPAAVEGSLKRLKTDYIDLYQFHWPNRGSYMFRQNWTYDPSGRDPAAVKQDIEDCLGALQREVDAGRIRAFGMSNESAWGLTRWADAAERGAGPRIASVQNEYSLMCRLADTDVAEVCCNEDIGMLSFSPLAAGFLTGKYIGNRTPDGSRRSLNPEMGGRMTDRANPAAAAYVALAEKHGLDPVHMALAFVRDRPFMASVIFGATTLAQLEHILCGMDLVLSDDVLEDLDRAHRAHPMPY